MLDLKAKLTCMGQQVVIVVVALTTTKNISDRRSFTLSEVVQLTRTPSAVKVRLHIMGGVKSLS